jgi:hypothetical protein
MVLADPEVEADRVKTKRDTTGTRQIEPRRTITDLAA